MLKYRQSYSIYRLFHSTMSKTRKRNRNIHSLSALDKFSSSSLKHDRSQVSTLCAGRKEHYFGELIEEEYSPPFYKPEYDIGNANPYLPLHQSKWKTDDYVDVESITSGITDIKLVKSLSSSPSWSDDNDTDGSRKVQDELERMDRVLRGIDPIPAHYDMDEYKQWMETFPNISLFGRKETEPNVVENKNSYTPIQFNIAGFNSKDMKQCGDEIKQVLISNIHENVTARLNGKSQVSTPSIKTQKKSPKTNDLARTQSFLKDCLKSSPFTPVIDRHRKNCFITRNNSREDDVVEESTGFESLPLVWERPSKISEATFNIQKTESLKVSGRRKFRKNVILPPIENRLNSVNHFRSISATPTYSSMFSAKSMNLERKLPSGTTEKF